MIMTKMSKQNISNDFVAAASFLVYYSLLFLLYKHFDGNVKNTIFSLHIFGNVDRGANHDFTIFPCDGRAYRMILQQQLVFYLIICVYFSCKSSLTEKWKIRYFPCTSSETSKMDSMSYPVASAVTKRYVLKFHRGKSSSNEVLLPTKSIFCES